VYAKAVTARFLAILFVISVATTIAACGNKGPLYLPKADPAAEPAVESKSGSDSGLNTEQSDDCEK
jgi:predicted small lipoprotein YifL